MVMGQLRSNFRGIVFSDALDFGIISWFCVVNVLRLGHVGNVDVLGTALKHANCIDLVDQA